MLKIWGRKNSINVQKVLWTCAELNLKYDRVDAGMQFGVNKTPEYLAGQTLTMGDIPMGVALHRWFALPIERPSYPKLQAYYERLNKRPGYMEFCVIPLT